MIIMMIMMMMMMMLLLLFDGTDVSEGEDLVDDLHELGCNKNSTVPVHEQASESEAAAAAAQDTT